MDRGNTMPFYEALDNEKFFVEEITGTKVEQDSERYYKVKWQQSWVPASRLQAWQDLIIKFWEKCHCNIGANIMEKENCEKEHYPEVYIITSDYEGRQQIQATTSKSEDVRKTNKVAVTQKLSTSVNSVKNDDYMLSEDQDVKNTVRLFTASPLEDIYSTMPYTMVDSTERKQTKDESSEMEYVSPDDFSFQQMPYSNYDGNSLVTQPLMPPYSHTKHSNNKRQSTSKFQKLINQKDDDKKKFNCGFCNKIFIQCSSLKQHMLSHTKEKPYQCNVCCKRYSLKGDLNRHMYTHLPNKELPLKCPICNRGFVRKDKIKHHIKSYHGKRVECVFPDLDKRRDVPDLGKRRNISELGNRRNSSEYDKATIADINDGKNALDIGEGRNIPDLEDREDATELDKIRDHSEQEEEDTKKINNQLDGSSEAPDHLEEISEIVLVEKLSTDDGDSEHDKILTGNHFI